MTRINKDVVLKSSQNYTIDKKGLALVFADFMYIRKHIFTKLYKKLEKFNPLKL